MSVSQTIDRSVSYPDAGTIRHPPSLRWVHLLVGEGRIRRGGRQGEAEHLQCPART
jgi:hypothetical protein